MLKEEKPKIEELMKEMLNQDGSDLFITYGFCPAIKKNGDIVPIHDQVLDEETITELLHSIMTDKQKEEFTETNQSQFAVSNDEGRFRVSVFRQQGKMGAVLRTINTEIPDFDSLGLPQNLKEIIMKKRGLVIVVGATGSGKSTSMAAMLGHRNKNSPGHIITIEDPVEYIHQHNKSIITQREVGIDTLDWDSALKNTLRQAPDVILIGEIRSKETMEYAINFAETGHLVLSTLHANNANQALDRIINFFENKKREQLFMDLSLNLISIISQRLVKTVDDQRTAAIEILLNSSYVSNLIFKGRIGEIKEAMKNATNQGMITFDNCLFDLYENNKISYEQALKNADSKDDLKLKIKQYSEKEENSVNESLADSLRIKDE